MESVHTTVGELKVGDLLILPESPRHDLRPVQITRLHSTRRSGRICIWVVSLPRQRSTHSTWNYGVFDPSHPIERLVDE